MSLQTWKQQFYVEPAREFTYLDNSLSYRIEATKHSLRKWIGARERWQLKHNVEFHSARLYDETPDNWFDFDADSCSLCQLVTSKCVMCPLSYETDNCTKRRTSPYGLAYYEHNPEAMIHALKTTLRRLIKQQYLNQPR